MFFPVLTAAAHDQWQVKRCRQQKKRNMIKEENFVKISSCIQATTATLHCRTASLSIHFFEGKSSCFHTYQLPQNRYPSPASKPTFFTNNDDNDQLYEDYRPIFTLRKKDRPFLIIHVPRKKAPLAS